VNEGKILIHDKAYHHSDSNNIRTVQYFLKQAGYKHNIPHKGGLFQQIKMIGTELIFPNTIFNKEWLNDKKMLMLALIGLAPAFLIRFTFASFLTYYSIALYFSMIWGLFFFYLLKTRQIKTKITICLFFILQKSFLKGTPQTLISQRFLTTSIFHDYCFYVS
jgi:hypothetical protein